MSGDFGKWHNAPGREYLSYQMGLDHALDSKPSFPVNLHPDPIQDGIDIAIMGSTSGKNHVAYTQGFTDGMAATKALAKEPASMSFGTFLFGPPSK
jgi:hypothetical protein